MTDCAPDWDRLRSGVARLMRATDALNEGIAALEAKLRAENPGVSAWVRVDMDHHVGWTRIGREWSLAWQGLGPSPTRLLSESRAVRLVALGHLPALVNEIVREAERLSAVLEAGLPDPRPKERR